MPLRRQILGLHHCEIDNSLPVLTVSLFLPSEPMYSRFSQPCSSMAILRTSNEEHVRTISKIVVKRLSEGLIGCHRCSIVATRTQLIALAPNTSAELGALSRYAFVVQWLPTSHFLWNGCTRMALILHGALLTRQRSWSHERHVEMPFSVGAGLGILISLPDELIGHLHERSANPCWGDLGHSRRVRSLLETWWLVKVYVLSSVAGKASLSLWHLHRILLYVDKDAFMMAKSDGRLPQLLHRKKRSATGWCESIRCQCVIWKFGSLRGMVPQPDVRQIKASPIRSEYM
jgi:hypothetical protein